MSITKNQSAVLVEYHRDANELLQETIREQATRITNLEGQIARLARENQKLKSVVEAQDFKEKLGDQILAEVMRKEDRIWTSYRGKIYSLFQLRENDLESVYADCVAQFREAGKINFDTPIDPDEIN